MVGDVLHKKLLRDVGRVWAQFAAAAAVVFCATAIFVGFQMTYRSLLVSRDTYYERYNFADFWVHLEKAPRSALADVALVPGVWRVRGRVVKDVPLEIPGKVGSVVGRFISMPPERREMINDIHLVTGGYFPGAAAEEVIVNQRFAEANALRIGDTFQATINERKETLRIVGTAISPEYVYPLRNVQQFAPDDEGFALVFARESFVEDAFDMTNEFNQVTGLLRPGANADRVLDRIEQELKPYGVYVKYSRKDQVSNRYLTEELKGVKSSAQVVPMVFLVVAAVVVHIIVHRLTEMQRTQIGLLCAMGYSKLRVVSHYVSYALIIAVVGTAAGSLGGYHMAGAFMRMYNRFFRFPALRVVFQPSAVVLAFVLSGGMCMLGAARSAWNVLKMQPAQAIRPSTGASERTVRPGRLSFLWSWLPLNWRMTVRSAVRSRARSLFCVFGVAVSTMMLVVGATTMDYFDWLIAYQFGQVDRSDVRVDFANERPEAAVLEIEKVEGVRRAEGILQVGGQLRNGWRTKRVVIMGLPRDSRLYHVYDAADERLRLPQDGLLVPERVAQQIALSRGGSVILDPYVRDKDDLPVAIRGMAEQYMGVEIYADRHYLARALGEGDMVNGVLAAVDRPRIQHVMDRLDDLPGVMAVTSARTMLEGIQQEVADMMNVAVVIQTIAAGVIAFAVIYNAASVSISEQERDLACLRSLGYEPGDVADIATNDIMPLGLVGIALGLPLAYLACHGIAKAYETDLYKLPVIVSPVTYGRAVVQAMVFLVVARWISRRRVHRIDIVRRLKTRE